jgi:UDP-N-acetylglucosamine:LPS N-acetylglucosamine transferase
MKDVILLAGGGGHTAYALALAQNLTKKCNLKIIVPEGDELSFKRLSKFGTVETLLKPRGPKTGLGPFLVNFVKAFFRCFKIVKGKSVIVSTGSNFAIPPCLVAKMRGGTIINLVESIRFVERSKTTNILSNFSKITALQWPEQKKLYPKGEVFGPMLAKSPIEPYNGGYILVTGGTFGHKSLFQTLDSLELENIVLQTGPVSSQSFSQKHPNWKIIKYTDKFEEILAGAEVVVTHFGATIIESTLIHGKPTVIAFNPEWKRSGRYDDLLGLAKKTNAVLLEELNPENLIESIEKAKKQKPPIIESGANLLAKRILEIASLE